MSAVEALKVARAAGIELAHDGGDLALSAALAPPSAVLDALSRHKAEILALLQPGDSWSGEDWQVYFDANMVIRQVLGDTAFPGPTYPLAVAETRNSRAAAAGQA